MLDRFVGIGTIFRIVSWAPFDVNVGVGVGMAHHLLMVKNRALKIDPTIPAASLATSIRKTDTARRSPPVYCLVVFSMFISHLILSYLPLSHLTLFYLVLSYLMLYCLVLYYLILSYIILYCPILYYIIFLYLILFCLVLSCIPTPPCWLAVAA